MKRTSRRLSFHEIVDFISDSAFVRTGFKIQGTPIVAGTGTGGSRSLEDSQTYWCPDWSEKCHSSENCNGERAYFCYPKVKTCSGTRLPSWSTFDDFAPFNDESTDYHFKIEDD